MREGHIDVVHTLLKQGADPRIEDDSGRTALDFARKNNNLKLVRLMSEVAGG